MFFGVLSEYYVRTVVRPPSDQPSLDNIQPDMFRHMFRHNDTRCRTGFHVAAALSVIHGIDHWYPVDFLRRAMLLIRTCRMLPYRSDVIKPFCAATVAALRDLD